MQVEEVTEADVAVLCMTGRLDALTTPGVEQRLLASARSGRPLVLDLGGMEYTSSAGLRLILKAAKEARAAGGRLALAAMRPAVREVITVSGFSSIIDTYPTRAEAVAALG